MKTNVDIRYPKAITTKVSEEIKEFIPYPQSENVREVLEWLYESFKNEGWSKVKELIK